MKRTWSYDQPFHWWGPRWAPESSVDLAHLLRDETLGVAEAAFLWGALANRRSLTVIGGPSLLGKTTLLTALLPLLSADTQRVYLRGSFETFGFLDDPRVDPHSAALLINEISPHLPIYLWGTAVERVLAAAERGFTVLATAHGSTVPEFVASLTGSPLRIPAQRVAALDIVVLLERAQWAPSGRTVSGIWELAPVREGLALTRHRTSQHDISQETSYTTPKSHPAPLTQPLITQRIAYLQAIRAGEIATLPAHLDAALPVPKESP